MVVGDVDLLHAAAAGMAGRGVSPEGQGGGVAPRHGRFPKAWPAAEDRLGRGGPDAATPVFPHHEELGHVAVGRLAAVRIVVDERQARELAVHPDQQRNAGRLDPVGGHRLIGGEAAVVLQLVARLPGPLFGEVVDVELHQVVEDRPLLGTGQIDGNGHFGHLTMVSVWPLDFSVPPVRTRV